MCKDHWHCDPDLVPHRCSQKDRTKPCPSCGEQPAKWCGHERKPGEIGNACNACEAARGIDAPRSSETPAVVGSRRLIDGRTVPELATPTVVIESKAPGKWVCVDMETGDAWNGQTMQTASADDKLLAGAILATTSEFDWTAPIYAVLDKDNGFVEYHGCGKGHLVNGIEEPEPMVYADAVRLLARWLDCGYLGRVVYLREAAQAKVQR